MNVILLGAPGAGKGTQGALLSRRAGLPTVATGDLLRAAVKKDTALGRRAKRYMDQGLLVPDEVILGLIEDVLNSTEARHGVIMDGFPRTIQQADAVDQLLAGRGVQVDRVLTFEVPQEELVSRMLGRAAKEGRTDDTPETIRQRLQVYRQDTEPLVDYYRRRGLVTPVDATGTVAEVAERVERALAA
jgi:adenylate kinase